MNDWDRCYTRDFTDEWDEKPLIEHRRMNACPLCGFEECVPWCYNVRHDITTQEGSFIAENVERGRKDMEQAEGTVKARDAPQEDTEIDVGLLPRVPQSVTMVDVTFVLQDRERRDLE